MDKKLIEEAQDGLQILTIKLHSSKIIRADDFVRDEVDEKPMLQGMQQTRSVHLDADFGDEAMKILRVFITIGIRGIRKQGESGQENGSDEAPSEDQVRFQLEATFRADYQLKQKVTKEALQEFTRYNVTHNVWPFWRQHVFDMVARADLPELQIGLYPGHK